jgi:hypothetical protein
MDRSHELGVAVSDVGARPYVNERASQLGQAWGTTRLGERWSGSVLFGFDRSALLLGGALRYDAVRTRPFVAAVETELGLSWAAFSLPLGVRVADRFVAYCSPRIGNWGASLTGFIPCGLSADVYQGLVLRAEAQLSWARFEYYERRLHLGLGIAQQW